MIKKILITLLVMLLAAGAVYKFIAWRRSHGSDAFKPFNEQQILAVFNNNSFTPLPGAKTNHYTLSWTNNLANALPDKAIATLLDNGQSLFINLEIRPTNLIDDHSKRINERITDGEYDNKLKALCAVLSKATSTVYFSYNREMEVPTNKFPWQNQSCSQYIFSFRHIYTMVKKNCPAVKIVWSPSGYAGTEEYYPGDEFCDYVSINLTNQQEVTSSPYPPFATTEAMIERKIFRMRFCSKPILLLSSASVKPADISTVTLTMVQQAISADAGLYHLAVQPNEDTVSSQRTAPLIIGVYDPKLKLANQPLLTTEHIFTDLNGVEDGSLQNLFDGILTRKHDVILTFETWKDKYRIKDSLLLKNIVLGKYDTVIAKLYKMISNVPQTVYLRWGHEMEIPVDRYPWQKQDPVEYIKAFRYVAGFEKNRAANIKIVWGPAGDRGSVEYWPGDDVVDYVSIAIYGLPDKNINDHNKQLMFSSIFGIKHHRIRFAKRPLFITEFGVKGPEDYKLNWLQDAAKTINKNKDIIGINYFSFSDVPEVWGKADTPDWSIKPATFVSFTGLLQDVPKK